jgi:hypothetical protein
MNPSVNSLAPHHLPAFITAPGETDVLMTGVGIFLLLVVLGIGVLFLTLHTLPERLAHKSQKLQFEIVAVLGLLALFTHIHLFWVIGLLLAMIDLPDFGGPLRRMAASLEKLVGIKPEESVPADTHKSREVLRDERHPVEPPKAVRVAPAPLPPAEKGAGNV